MKILKLQDSIGKTYRRQSIVSTEFNRFVLSLKSLLANVKDEQSEEIQKGHLKDFLADSFYSNYIVGPAEGNIDLAIRLDNTSSSNVGVVFEVKSTTNRHEMITLNSLNRKALQELVFYFLRERERGNNDMKYLVATNLVEFFIFDAQLFERLFYKNKRMLKEYNDFVSGRKTSSTTEFFYKEIAAKYIDEVYDNLELTHFSLNDYRQSIRNGERSRKLADLYRIFSPTHLLKLPFLNDNNRLNSAFYKELLHLIGLSEYKENGKVVIKRVQENPNIASLIENTINVIDSEDITPPHYVLGRDHDERLFNASIELNITWINRILFLKLLESQLINYHNGDQSYRFLTYERIPDFDTLNRLYFQVLGVEEEARNSIVKELFPKVPYLNSSLFEVAQLERDIIKMSNLSQTEYLPLYRQSVLYKDERYHRTKAMPFLQYLFAFLDAYDFASEGNEEFQEQSKTLINASVLGLIFEKINGYKDGSIFTPGFITSYMCRESITKVVVDKFNAKYGWHLSTYEQLLNTDIPSIKEANELINSITLCDPAVGSGHFLVSALNEIIHIKYELGVLLDTESNRIKKRDYVISIENDEMVITDADGELWSYNPQNPESRRIQQALFNEKRTIIENCLFGVDINPNSVNICRLRLWIELLKNAYYTPESGFTHLETLPNIDINIKCGNSMLHQYELSGKLEFPKIKEYGELVRRYKASKSKADKQELESKIKAIKSAFTDLLNERNPVVAAYRKAQMWLQFVNDRSLFDGNGASREEQRRRKQEKVEAEKAYKKASRAYEKAKANAFFQSGFEWRIEFPEILDDKGSFIGFDLIIGNPPYLKEGRVGKDVFAKLKYSPYYVGKMDIWYMFACYGIDLLKQGGYLNFIATNNWITNAGARVLRSKVLNDAQILQLCDFGSFFVFDNASIQTMIMLFQKCNSNQCYRFDYRNSLSLSSHEDVKMMLSKISSSSYELYNPTLNRVDYQDRYFVFSKYDEILNTIYSGNDRIFLKEQELTNGIHPHYDFVNSRLSSKFNIPIGTGIFGLSEAELNQLNLDAKELNFIKSYYPDGSLVHRYWVEKVTPFKIIYTTSEYKKPNSMDAYPHLKAHLDRFSNVISSDNKPYGLHRARIESFFNGEKIAVLRKSANYPVFSYSDSECYLSATFYVIKTDRVDLKYLTGVLNSKLIEFWLRNKGKMQGENFQLDKEPLQQIPIIQPTADEQKQISDIVSEIILAKSSNKDTDTSTLERQIDILVYRLYGLKYSDVLVIDPDTNILESEFSVD